MNVLFWIVLFIIVYAYCGYPVLLLILSRFKRREPAGEQILPSVSIIVAAYNEEKNIARKITRSLQLDYPPDRIEIIVASDGSSDGTCRAVENFTDTRVKLISFSERHGKTFVQNEAAKRASGEILVFSDATTVYEPGILKALVRNFSDPSVGGVGGELRYVNLAGSAAGQGEGFYWKYERLIKRLECRVSSLIGVSGCCYAVRRSLYEDIPIDLISDFVVAQLLYEKGKRTVYEPGAVSYEETNDSFSDEFSMRVRVAVRTLHGMWRMRRLLNPFKYGIFAVQLISHKFLRYLIPVFLFTALFLNILLIGNSSTLYGVLFLAQIVFYSAVIAGWMFRGKKYVSIPFYFFITNIALAVGFIRFLSGEKQVVWKPIRK